MVNNVHLPDAAFGLRGGARREHGQGRNAYQELSSVEHVSLPNAVLVNANIRSLVWTQLPGISRTVVNAFLRSGTSSRPFSTFRLDLASSRPLQMPA